MRERVLRGGTNRFLIVRERRKGEEGIAKADLGAPQRRQQVIFCIDSASTSAMERPSSEISPRYQLPLPNSLSPNAYGVFELRRKELPSAEKNVLPRLDNVDPPEAALAAQQYRNEACGGS